MTTACSPPPSGKTPGSDPRQSCGDERGRDAACGGHPAPRQRRLSTDSVSLTLVGFATAFELVVLAVSASRRGATEVVVAAVVGSFAYNSTMTLGAAALVRPLEITGADRLHLPLIFMLGAIALAIALGSVRGHLSRLGGVMLLACYPVFVAAVLLHG